MDQTNATSTDGGAVALPNLWYHTIELPDGRVTDGTVDHRSMSNVLLPADLSGLNCLDVGTFDGYWAFEMERRGATAVTAIDLERFDQADWPPRNRQRLLADGGDQDPGQRFWIAHSLLNSQVKRVTTPIYEISPQTVGERFDRIIISDLLLHLRDPVGALQAVRSVMGPESRLLVAEEINVKLSLFWPRRAAARLQTDWTDYGWWQGNVAGIKEWLHQAGFKVVGRTFYRLNAEKRMAVPHVAYEVMVDPDYSL